MGRATTFLLQAFAIALFLIMVVLVAQFNSIGQPFIIMISVFLSIGGSCGVFSDGQVFIVIMSGIGCIARRVCVNNCIVLVDYTNKRIASGDSPEEAIISTKTRFRPVI